MVLNITVLELCSNVRQRIRCTCLHFHCGDIVVMQVQWLCRCFDNARQVFIHVMKIHIPFAADGVCRWEGCEPLQRKKWSMVTHVQVAYFAQLFFDHNTSITFCLSWITSI